MAASPSRAPPNPHLPEPEGDLATGQQGPQAPPAGRELSLPGLWLLGQWLAGVEALTCPSPDVDARALQVV